MTEVVEAALITEKNETQDRMLATLKADPIESTDPTDPIERIDPADPIDRIEPVDPIDHSDPGDVVVFFPRSITPPILTLSRVRRYSVLLSTGTQCYFVPVLSITE